MMRIRKTKILGKQIVAYITSDVVKENDSREDKDKGERNEIRVKRERQS